MQENEKRIPLKRGTAVVDKDVKSETVEDLNNLVECAHNQVSESLRLSDVRISLDRYHQTLKSIDSRIDGAKNADSVNERIWHLDLARKMIREELYLYPLPESSES